MNRKARSVRRLTGYAALALLNVLALVAIAAYFSGQRIDLLTVVGIVADSVGVVTGLLGIWFFFMSEQLNRRSAVNLELTTATVRELQTQMWHLIERTFDYVCDRGAEEGPAQAEKAIAVIEDQVASGEPLGTEVEEAVGVLKRTLEAQERSRELRELYRPPMVVGRSLPLSLFAYRLADIHRNSPPITLEKAVSSLCTYYSPRDFGATDWEGFFATLIDRDYLRVAEGWARPISPVTPLDPGSKMQLYLASPNRLFTFLEEE